MELSWTRGDTSFAHPLLMWLLGGLVLVVLVVAVVVRRRRLPAQPTYVAHAARLRALPRYRTLVARRTVLAALATAFALVACTGGVLLAGRLQQTRTLDQDERTRDIMLCLDASGSMQRVDVSVLAEFRKIVDGLRGERIGLTIWDGAAITIFPLTDDYGFAAQQLDEAERAFRKQDYTYLAGLGVGAGSSLIGDGLVSCVQRFDRPDEERGRAIVLATDNEPYGRPIYTFQQAGDYARQHHVVVHAIAPPHVDDVRLAAEELDQVATETGGTYHRLGADASVGEVVTAIESLEAAKIDKPPLVQVVDQPRFGKVVTALGVGLLGVLWAVEGGFALAMRRARRTPGQGGSP